MGGAQLYKLPAIGKAEGCAAWACDQFRVRAGRGGKAGACGQRVGRMSPGFDVAGPPRPQRPC